MKRFLTPALAAAVLFSACDAGQALRVEVTDRVISSDYVGNGVEWTLTTKPKRGARR